MANQLLKVSVSFRGLTEVKLVNVVRTGERAINGHTQQLIGQLAMKAAEEVSSRVERAETPGLKQEEMRFDRMNIDRNEGEACS